MINRTQISFVVSGDTFQPSTLDVLFSKCEDPGSIGKKGRYRGIPIPQGWATIDVPESVDNGIHYLHDLVMPILPDLCNAGMTDSYIQITFYYENQCALGFDSEEIQMLSDFGCAVSIDCWENKK